MEDQMDYKSSGVDIEAGYKSVELMKQYVKTTMRPEVLGGLGGFSGAFSWKRSRIWKSLPWYPVQMVSEPKSSSPFFWTSMIPSVSTALPCA